MGGHPNKFLSGMLTFGQTELCTLYMCSVAQSCPAPWTVAHQALSTGFSRQEYWSGLPFPTPFFLYTYHQYIPKLPHPLFYCFLQHSLNSTHSTQVIFLVLILHGLCPAPVQQIGWSLDFLQSCGLRFSLHYHLDFLVYQNSIPWIPSSPFLFQLNKLSHSSLRNGPIR